MGDGPVQHVTIPVGDEALAGDLTIPRQALGLVIFAHGSGSSRHSPRNQQVAAELQAASLATLLMDLLTTREEAEERYTRHHRFDIGLLVGRLAAATDFVSTRSDTAGLAVGYFGASTGAAAALGAAADAGSRIQAIVSRGGRPDLAGGALLVVTAPTLLIVGANDGHVLELNRQAMAQMGQAEVSLQIVPNATHLFAEPGALERVAELAAAWFQMHMSS